MKNSSCRQHNTDHHTSEKARVATVTAPKTLVLDPIVAPNALLFVVLDWTVVFAELVGEPELELTMVVPPVRPEPALLLAGAPVELEVTAGMDELAVDKVNEAEAEDPVTKLGAATAWEGLTSVPIPQEKVTPPLVVEFGAGVL